MISEIIDSFPADITRQLAFLECIKIGLYELSKMPTDAIEACDGANDVIVGILSKLNNDKNPIELCNKDRDIRITNEVFEPLKNNLTERELLIYQAVLNTLELQIRKLHDTHNNA